MAEQLGVLTEESSVIKGGRREHPIEKWDGYGVVCPTLVTSNGNAMFVASCLSKQLGLRSSRDLPDFKARLVIGGEDCSNLPEAQIHSKLCSAAHYRL